MDMFLPKHKLMNTDSTRNRKSEDAYFIFKN